MILDFRNFCQNLHPKQILDFLLCVHPIVKKLKQENYQASESQAGYNPEAAELQPIRKTRFHRRAHRVDDAAPSSVSNDWLDPEW